MLKKDIKKFLLLLNFQRKDYINKKPPPKSRGLQKFLIPIEEDLIHTQQFFCM
jgi:hypothetical protein